ncbi:MAG: sulfurtransferase [Dehalococcoidia bacterium]|nr:sulfurtransferase [Dehalococcoidia bacterium]
MSAEVFARPDLLVDPQWLHQRLNDPSLRIVDCDPRDAYFRIHIPGAVPVPDNYYKNPDDRRFMMRPEQFKALMESLGIGDDTLVVGYDARQSLYAARLWWCLTYYGHSKVKVLNGGFPRWFREQRPLCLCGARHTYPPATFTPRPTPSVLATAEDIKERIARQDTDTVLWDVRSLAEYTGENTRGNKRAGHMPGAIHLEWLELVDRESHTFKDPATLRRMLAEKGITPEKEVIAY